MQIKYPRKTQSADADDIERTQSLDISDFLNRTMGSVILVPPKIIHFNQT